MTQEKQPEKDYGTIEKSEEKKVFEDGINLVGLSNIIDSELNRISYLHLRREHGDGSDTPLERFVQDLRTTVNEMQQLAKKYERMDKASRIYQHMLISLDVRLPEEYKEQFSEFLAEKK